MSQTLLSLAGFQVILIGRFWVIAEAFIDKGKSEARITLRRLQFQAAKKGNVGELARHLKGEFCGKNRQRAK